MRRRPAGALVGALAALSLAAAAVRAGLETSPVRGLTVRDSALRGVTKGSRIEHAEDLVLRNVVLEPLE